MTSLEISKKTLSWFREQRIFFEHREELSRLKEGDTLHFDDTAELEPYCGILGGNTLCSMGSFSYSWAQFITGMKLGRYCSIAEGFRVAGTRHPMEKLSTSSFMYDTLFTIIGANITDHATDGKYDGFISNPQDETLEIGHDVWIGGNVTVLPSIKIKHGAVLATQSVVTKDVPPYAIVGGNPAKIIRYRFDQDTIDALLELEWWNYNFVDFEKIDKENIGNFIKEFRHAQPDLEPFCPKKIKISDIVT